MSRRHRACKWDSEPTRRLEREKGGKGVVERFVLQIRRPQRDGTPFLLTPGGSFSSLFPGLSSQQHAHDMQEGGGFGNDGELGKTKEDPRAREIHTRSTGRSVSSLRPCLSPCIPTLVLPLLRLIRTLIFPPCTTSSRLSAIISTPSPLSPNHNAISLLVSGYSGLWNSHLSFVFLPSEYSR